MFSDVPRVWMQTAHALGLSGREPVEDVSDPRAWPPAWGHGDQPPLVGSDGDSAIVVRHVFESNDLNSGRGVHAAFVSVHFAKPLWIDLRAADRSVGSRDPAYASRLFQQPDPGG